MAAPTTQLPSTAAAHFARAVQRHLAGDDADAMRSYRKAIAADRSLPEPWNNLGTLLAKAGRVDEAREHFECAIALKPAYGEALNNLGILHVERGDHAAALDAFKRAVATDGTRVDWLNSLANAYVEQFRYPEALDAYDRAIALDASNVECWSNRALALRGMRRADEAIASLHRALELRPDHVDALSNLGIILKEQKRFAEAEAALARATGLAPRNPALWVNYASVFEMQGDYARMRALAQRALDIDPGYVEAHNLFANAALEDGNLDKAEETLLRVVASDPANRNANWNLALIWLMRGDFVRGWTQYEWRKRIQSVVLDHFEYPGDEWDGSPLEGRSILIYSEQGIGDAIQFVRYAAELKRRGAGAVYVECPYPIAPLLTGVEGVDAVVARGLTLPPVALNASMMSLPLLLGTTLETIPSQLPYIPHEPRPVASLVTAPEGTRKIGIVWAGSTAHARDFLRSAPLALFRQLFEIPRTRFFSLQKGEAAEAQLRDLPTGLVTDLAPHLDDFRDTAAAIHALDLVITVDTSVAHLAGAMGAPTWLLLPSVPDFRWMLDRDDSPWYPSMRLFRQPVARDWDTVFTRIATALREPPPSTVANAPAREARPRDSEGDIVTLASATRLPDGRPRFDLWFPLTRLASSEAFDEYQTELLGSTYEEGARTFLDAALRPDDRYVDLAPGLGLSLLTAATAPRHPASAYIVTPDATDVSRLAQLVARRTPNLLLLPSPTPREALLSAREASSGEGRVIARAGAEGRAEGVADAVGTIPAASRPDAIVWPDAARVGVAESMRFLETLGYLHVAASMRDGELSLDALPDDLRGITVISLTERCFASLGEGGDPAARRAVGIDWELRADTGWGVYGTNLAATLVRHPLVRPAIFAADLREATPIARRALEQALGEGVARASEMNAQAPEPYEFDGVMLRALANNFEMGPLRDRVRATRNVGVVFFEDTTFEPDALARARELDLIVTGSRWNEGVLRARGIANVTTVLQGIDPTIFHPAPRSSFLADRFVIFSGGKLEYRKGQDLVVAAFREFHARHPEALLVVAWHNAWPQLISDLSLAGHVAGLPTLRDDTLAIAEWLADNGVFPGALLDVGRQPNALMGQVVREADVALFPNRCEGGTNLVAMECMASGVPTIVSANTGHLDLIATGGCLPLATQRPVAHPTRFYEGCEGWGESDVAEIVETLEQVYSDRAEARRIAMRGADALADMTWERQTQRFVEAIRPLL